MTSKGSPTHRRTHAPQREALTRDRVVAAAVAMADEHGIEAVSMRQLAQGLGVVPMAFYRHVANKEELLDGMVDAVLSEVELADRSADWKTALRAQVISAREALLRHPWARRVMESRTAPTPAALHYMDTTIATLTAGGLSVDLTHHAMHALGGRIFGFTQELYDASPTTEPLSPETAEQLAQAYPNIAAVAASRPHETGSVVGSGCDDQFEFEFALDLVLNGIERLHQQGWAS